ncbi:Hypothetical protein, putative [Bodo saltans]|uniref:Uncharacterized protein n=1 Tax=Bodo saltans TaxID=75058 RepID=A0A0S4JQY1_BODSA|nr:Hypothetical protein, putative [Bodo saltans]|eukprot:CUG93927.1 Hypothetical protein, putative [Bodo saltans]
MQLPRRSPFVSPDYSELLPAATASALFALTPRNNDSQQQKSSRQQKRRDCPQTQPFALEDSEEDDRDDSTAGGGGPSLEQSATAFEATAAAATSSTNHHHNDTASSSSAATNASATQCGDPHTGSGGGAKTSNHRVKANSKHNNLNNNSVMQFGGSRHGVVLPTAVAFTNQQN